MDSMPHQQLDITGTEFPVQVEIDNARRVLYVHVDGITVLRICRMPADVEVVSHAGSGVRVLE